MFITLNLHQTQYIGLKEIKIQNENNNKRGKKLEIVLDNEKD